MFKSVRVVEMEHQEIGLPRTGITPFLVPHQLLLSHERERWVNERQPKTKYATVHHAANESEKEGEDTTTDERIGL